MSVVLLTTDTTHHTYWAWQLAQRHELGGIVLETRRAEPPFETYHPFEAAREEYERDVLLAGCDTTLQELAPCVVVPSATEAVEDLARRAPDVVLVFGTGILRPEVIAVPRIACLNLHGGNPEEYRGLDTHLWTIYHRDWDNLVTTLHQVDETLDTGDVVSAAPVPVRPRMPLHELRAANTQVCVELSLRALADAETGTLPHTPQRRRGRYYSFMPAVLKERCVAEWERFTGVR